MVAAKVTLNPHTQNRRMRQPNFPRACQPSTQVYFVTRRKPRLINAIKGCYAGSATMALRTLAPADPAPSPTLSSRPNWKRLDGVDVLRGLAILFVVLNHVHMRLAIAHIRYVADTSKPLIASLVWNGQFGVQIFFDVSGFLITSTALRRWGILSNVRLRDFYLLRVARIAPMLWHCLP